MRIRWGTTFSVSDFGFRTSVSVSVSVSDFSFRKVSEKNVQFFAIFRQKISFPDILLINRYVTHFPITLRQGNEEKRGLGERGIGKRAKIGGEARREGTLPGRVFRIGSSGSGLPGRVSLG